MAIAIAVKETKLNLVLELTQEEAAIILAWTQNPSKPSESAVEQDLRKVIFLAIQKEIK